MELHNAIDNYQANVEQSDAELAQSIKLSECEHHSTTASDDGSISEIIICKDCGKSFDENEWTDYKKHE